MRFNLSESMFGGNSGYLATTLAEGYCYSASETVLPGPLRRRIAEKFLVRIRYFLGNFNQP